MTTERNEVTSQGETHGRMKIARLCFTHPSGIEITETVEVPRLFLGGTKFVERTHKQTKAEVLADLHHFINELQPGRLVNVCEYREALEFRGDDNRMNWVVWYWEPEE